MIPGVIVRKNNTHTHTHTHTKTDPRQTEFSVTEIYNLRQNLESKRSKMSKTMKLQSLLPVRSLCRNGAGGTYLAGQLLQRMETHRVSTRVQFAGPVVLIGWTTYLHLSSIRLCSLIIQWSSNVCLVGCPAGGFGSFHTGGGGGGGGLSPRSLGSKNF
jgi:hypothetical protein